MSSFSSYRSNLNDSERRPAEGGQWRSRNSIYPLQGQLLKANTSWGQGDPTRERGWRKTDYQGRSGRSGNDFQATSSSSIQTSSFSTTSHALPEHRHKKARRELKPLISPLFEPTWPAPQSLSNLLLTPPTLENTPVEMIKVQHAPPLLFCGMPKENLGQLFDNNEFKAQAYEMATILHEVYGFALPPLFQRLANLV